MKKKSLLFSFISIVILVVVVLSVIFVPKLKNKENDIDVNPSTKNEEYATYFAVNLPNTINLYLNSYVTLKQDYLNINPARMVNKIKIEITEDNISTNKLVFENNKITATEVGNYKIKFSVPSSETTSFSKTISVNVYQDIESAHIKMVSSSIRINDEVDMTSLFTIPNTNFEYIVTTDDKLTFKNDMFKANSIGESAVKFTFTEGNIEYHYQFKINVKDIAQYEIILTDVTNNTLELESGKAYYINYTVVNRNEGDVSQDIIAETSNEEIVVVEKIEEPLVKIKAKSTGSATINLIYALDVSITLEIKIIVK